MLNQRLLARDTAFSASSASSRTFEYAAGPPRLGPCLAVNATVVGMLAFLTLALVGCSLDLSSQSEVDGLRVLAVRAEPPEVNPGQSTTLDALMAYPPSSPTPPMLSYLWLACQPPVTQIAPMPCSFDVPDSGQLTLPTCAAEPGASVCLIGLDQVVSYTPDATSLAAGPTGSVNLMMVVADQVVGSAVACAQGAMATGVPANPDHCIITVKQLTVSQSSTPNHNPTLASFTLGSASLLDGTATFTLTPTAVTLAVTRTPGSAELVNGVYETLEVSFFATAGQISDSRTTFQPVVCDQACQALDPPLSTSSPWTPPTPQDAISYVYNGKIDFWAVVRDGRGGVGWLPTGLARESN